MIVLHVQQESITTTQVLLARNARKVTCQIQDQRIALLVNQDGTQTQKLRQQGAENASWVGTMENRAKHLASSVREGRQLRKRVLRHLLLAKSARLARMPSPVQLRALIVAQAGSMITREPLTRWRVTTVRRALLATRLELQYAMTVLQESTRTRLRPPLIVVTAAKVATTSLPDKARSQLV